MECPKKERFPRLLDCWPLILKKKADDRKVMMVGAGDKRSGERKERTVKCDIKGIIGREMERKSSRVRCGMAKISPTARLILSSAKTTE